MEVYMANAVFDKAKNEKNDPYYMLKITYFEYTKRN